MFSLSNSDPRITIDISVNYPPVTKYFSDTLFDFIIILPIHKNLNNALQVNSMLSSNNINNSIYFHSDQYLRIIEEGYYYSFFASLDDLLSLLCPNCSRSMAVYDLYRHLLLMINDFQLSVVNSEPVPVVLSKDDIIPLRVLLLALSTGSFGAHVIFYNYHSTASVMPLSDAFNLIKTRTTRLDNAEAFIEGGLSSSVYKSVPSFYNVVNNLIDSMVSYEGDFIYVFDSKMDKCLHLAYNDFHNTHAIYSSISPSLLYNKMLLSGWYLHNELTVPPSHAYLRMILHNYNKVRRFDSIVNVKIFDLADKPPICRVKPMDVRNNLFENQQILDGTISTANTLYRVPGSKFSVFLSDYTLMRDRNILRYENVVRAALYGKRKIQTIMSRYLGLRNADIDYSVIQEATNIELSAEPDLKSYVKILPEEQLNENTIVVNYFIEMPVTTYQIRLLVVAS